MTKTIIISIVASAMLFGANSTDTTNNQDNHITGSTLQSNIEVRQGEINISGTNTVTNSVTLGGEVHKDSLIDNVTADDANIAQGTIDISNSRVDGLSVNSDNKLLNVTISDELTLKQGTVTITDANKTAAPESDVSNVTFNSENNINSSGKIQGTGTVVSQGTLDVSNSKLQTAGIYIKNDITGTLSIDGSATNPTKVTQGTTAISNDSTVTDYNVGTNEGSHLTNSMNNIEATNGATVMQNDAVISNSTVIGLSNVGSNTIDGTNISGGTATQNTIDIDSSTVNGMRVSQTNSIEVGSITTNQTIKQGDISIKNGSKVSELDVDYTNTVGSGFSMGGTTTVEQGILKINDSNLSETSEASLIEITATNTLDNTGLINGGTIVQSKTSILADSTVKDMRLNQQNTIDFATVDDSNVSNTMDRPTISQAETEITGSKVTDFEQDVKNNIKGVKVTESSITQSKVYIANSTVDSLTMNEDDNIVENSTLDHATVSQGGVSITD